MKNWLQRSAIWFCAAWAGLTACVSASVPPEERTVILVSLDGFRWDYLQRFQPTNLVRLAKEGVQAERLIPAFPSLTFPNHYTLVTGLYPEHHGIIGNNFYDPEFKAHYNAFTDVSSESRWWGGEPIWVTAIKQGRTAKCMFWPGSQTEIGGVRPTEWKPFNKNTTFTESVDTVLGWLDATSKRPGFVTMYFHEPDSAGHKDGLNSPQLADAVKQVDTAIGRLVDGIQRLKLNEVVNLVIVSDHGMAELSPDRVITLGDFLDMSKVQVDFSGAVAGLRPLDGNVEALSAALKKSEKGFHLYRREQMPERFRFRNNDRIPPLVLLAEEGWQITPRTTAEQAGRTVLKATHGFDPGLPSMGGLFIAHGPAFQRGVTIAPEENVHVYNLLCATLGLKPASNDGDDRLARKVLLQ
ncbi:MAG TPA: ectonucleotide pyrophosphatase/phosphodiesterase [Verrucomicrobiae bacterium]|nr:ectonucleotide pyrophosphatase/phosphodiesterase [Verrucomicrobiae bacterium]